LTDLAAPESTRPKDLVFTLFGEYLLERADSVWVGSLIALLEPFGLTEGGVRTILSRMAKKGWLHAERVGRNAFYSLTPKGRRLLEEGQARIFHPTWDRAWDGSWLLLTYSIPQDERRLRDRLRDRLAWLGFGSFGNGIWLSPHDVAEQVEAMTEDLGLDERLVCFRARPVEEERTDELVARCWNLPDLARRYRAFVDRWHVLAEELGTAVAPERCYVLRFNLIHEFRRFPLEDPFLPRRLLPEPWAGDEASRLFLELHDRLVGPADAWVDGVLAAGPVRTSA
jgi:phenylacetic acid degradation operon negative regulatory protein